MSLIVKDLVWRVTESSKFQISIEPTASINKFKMFSVIILQSPRYRRHQLDSTAAPLF
jgi:hypothetical protein